MTIVNNKSVAIIGGGIAGCTTAYQLAERGFKVSLFERNDSIASEASGNPVGLLYPRLSGKNALSEFALQAYLESLKFYQSLHLPKDEFNNCGMLQLGFNVREQARILKVAKTTSDDIAKFVSASEASEISGITCKHDALFFPTAAWVKPVQICKKLVTHKNISLFTLNNVNNILKINNLFELNINHKLIGLFDVVIIANANEAKKISQTAHITTQSVRGQLTQLRATQSSQALKTVICSDGYFSPAVNGEHCLGATFSIEHDSTEITDFDHQQNLEKLKKMSEHLYTNLKDQILTGRTAFRCTSLDHFPLIGQLLNHDELNAMPPRPSAKIETLPWHQYLYVNLAHGSHGLITAPLAAKILSALICDEVLPIDENLAGLLNPNRFALRKLGLKKLAKCVANAR